MGNPTGSGALSLEDEQAQDVAETTTQPAEQAVQEEAVSATTSAE
jgi:hypothetical protein